MITHPETGGIPARNYGQILTSATVNVNAYSPLPAGATIAALTSGCVAYVPPAVAGTNDPALKVLRAGVYRLYVEQIGYGNLLTFSANAPVITGLFINGAKVREVQGIVDGYQDRTGIFQSNRSTEYLVSLAYGDLITARGFCELTPGNTAISYTSTLTLIVTPA